MSRDENKRWTMHVLARVLYRITALCKLYGPEYNAPGIYHEALSDLYCELSEGEAMETNTNQSYDKEPLGSAYRMYTWPVSQRGNWFQTTSTREPVNCEIS